MKLSVNALIGVTNLALSEVLVAAERSGIARDSAIGSPSIAYKREAFLDPDVADVFFAVYGEDDVVRMADVLRARAEALEASR